MARLPGPVRRFFEGQLTGPTNPAHDASWGAQERDRRGFFTDTSICIGCKACEVACKEWNEVPEDGLTWLGSSYDNSGGLGASTWRHVAFVEQGSEQITRARESGRRLVSLGMPSMRRDEQPTGTIQTVPTPQAPPPAVPTPEVPDVRWLMASDVCKHCTHAGCLDVCPTGALFRTEFGTVVVQPDVCNGCGYCVGACPFGVIERRGGQAQVQVPNEGVAQKCTLCYDRLGSDEQPACAKACPTTSIKYGSHDEMVELAQARVAQLHEQGITEARLYGANELDGVGGTGSVFLLLDEPEVYGLPPDPQVPTARISDAFERAGLAGTGMLLAAALAFAVGGRR